MQRAAELVGDGVLAVAFYTVASIVGHVLRVPFAAFWNLSALILRTLRATMALR